MQIRLSSSCCGSVLLTLAVEAQNYPASRFATNSNVEEKFLSYLRLSISKGRPATVVTHGTPAQLDWNERCRGGSLDAG